VLKFQRNAIIKAIVSGGLNTSDCAFDFDEPGVRVTHVPSGSYFLLEGDALAGYTATPAVGDLPPLPMPIYGWLAVVTRVERWAQGVKDDVDTPDLWAELQRERTLLTEGYQDGEDTPLTPDEQAEIAEQLQQIKEFVKETYSLSETKMRALEVELKYIQEASGRIGRKDLALLVFGVMFHVIVMGVLPPDAVHGVLAMLLQGIGHLFGGWGPPGLPSG
jgi:hypothetical protein